MKVRLLRTVVQGAFLVFWVLLFILIVFPLRSSVPVDLLLRSNPLAAILSFLAGRTVVSRMLLSVVLLGATFLLGRLFCGWVCPLGTAVDLADRPLSSSKLAFLKLKRVSVSPKFYLLGLLLLMALLGRSLLWLVDPLVIFIRSLTVLFYPAGVFAANLALDIFRPLAERWELDLMASAGFDHVTFSSWLLPALFLAFILGLGLMGRRLWCRALCPLGALLALVGRFAPLKRHVWAQRCTHCHLCRRSCPMGAVGEDEVETAYGQCIGCRVCAHVCPPKAVTFRFHGKSSVGKLDMGRRRFVFAAVLGVVGFALSRIKPMSPAQPSRRIRPPGAVPESVFLARCLRCGQCMKVCLTNGLQPATEEASPLGIWTPVLVPRKGGCERHCNMCGQVCPTQAIRSLSLEEKSFVRIGIAQVERSRCLEWNYGKTCLVCDEVCPYGAIFVERAQVGAAARRGPVVNLDVCVGCGMCEHHCPVPGEAAIRVAAQAEDRLLGGSYITVDKVRARQRVLNGKN